jgi:hypothetical protein
MLLLQSKAVSKSYLQIPSSGKLWTEITHLTMTPSGKLWTETLVNYRVK